MWNDALHWLPTGRNELQNFGKKYPSAGGTGWVMVGNYAKVRDISGARAATLVWLDLPLNGAWPLINRTFRRWITRETLWSGNRETLKGAIFSKDSLFLWMLKSRRRHRREYPQLVKEPQYAHLKVIHLTSAALVDGWLAGLSGD